MSYNFDVEALVGQSTHESVMGLIGEDPSTYSKSRIMWNAAFATFGIDAEYIPFDVKSDYLGHVLGFLHLFEKVRGFNVTVPYKEPVFERFSEHVDDVALRVGNVNTVRKKDGDLYCHSTDGYGALNSISEQCPNVSWSESIVTVLGAGGSGRAIAIAADNEGASVYLVNRTKSDGSNSAFDLVKRLSGSPVGSDIQAVDYKTEDGSLTMSIRNALIDSNIVINTLPIEKMDSNSHVLPSPGFDLRNKAIFMDIVYGDNHESRFLASARDHGHTAIEGEWMLLHQAIKAFEFSYEKEVAERNLTTAIIAARINEIINNLCPTPFTEDFLAIHNNKNMSI